MKILHLLPALTKGGGERVAVDLANESIRQGHQVSLVAAYPVDPAELADRLSTKVELRFISAAPPGRLAKFRTASRWVKANWEWIAGHDVVHAHLTFGGYVAGLIRSHRRRRGLVGPAVLETCHSVGMPMPMLKRSIWAHMAKNRDGLALMAEDDFWKGFCRRHPELPSAVILNGVSAPRQVPAEEAIAFRRATGIPDNARVAGTIGVMRPERRPLDFIHIFARMAQMTGPETHFLMGGGGALLPQVREAVAAAGLEDRIHLPGMIAEPPVALAGMDAYLTLNVGSVTGIAALEAAMAGLPIIALQAIDGYSPVSSDWIWSSADLAAVADRAVALLGDEVERGALAGRHQSYAVAHHSVAAMAQAYQGFYEAAIQAARHG